MATPTLGLLNHTEIDDADSNTDWTLLTSADADIKKEGTNAMSGIFRPDGSDGYVDGKGSISCSGKHLRMWVNTINTPYMQPESSNGYQVYVNDGTNTDYFIIFGSDTYPGGWFNAVIDCALFTTVTPANVQRWGLYANHASNAKNAINTWVDFVRYSDGYYITGGTSGDKVRLDDVATADRGTTTLYGYGIVEKYEGNYFASGEIQIGNGATTTYFEMDAEVLTFTDKPVADGLYALNGNGSGCDIVIVNSTISSSGTQDNNRVDADMSTGSPNSVSITDTVFIKCGTFLFASGQTITGNTFNNCEQISPGGADMRDCSIVGYEGATGTGALSYNVSGDPDGELDGIYFEKGTSPTHAIQFGTSAPTTMYLRNIEFSGYNASDQQNDSTLYFPDTGSDITWTVNVPGCTGNITYYKARSGDTVNIVANQVEHKLINLIDNSEVTYVSRGTPVDTGADGISVTGSRIFETSNSWTADAFRGMLLYIDNGAAEGRYYVSSNSPTALYLDEELQASETGLEYRLYDENDDSEEYHVESVTGGQTVFSYTYASNYYVDIIVIHTNYEQIVLEDILLPDSNTQVPLTQILDVNYYNP